MTCNQTPQEIPKMQTLTGLEYLKADVACNYDNGNDKKDWDVRILWTDQHEDSLESLLDSAEDPALYYASVKAYRAAQAGQPSGYPISLDACASNLQILSCLIGCEDSAKLCGVVSTGHRADAYTTIYDAMCEALPTKPDISRNQTKDAIMTAFFGSTAEPKKVFGEGQLLENFYHTMETLPKGAWQLNLAIKDLWQSDNLSHDWTLPDNHHVHVKVMDKTNHNFTFMNRPVEITTYENRPTETGRSLSANITHSVDGMIVREMTRRCQFDISVNIRVIEALNSTAIPNQMSQDDKMVDILWGHYLESGFLSARILDHLGSNNMGLVDPLVIANLIKSMPETPFEVMSIHDCFRVLPNYGNDVRKQYNIILSSIADSDLLEFITSQIVGYNLPVTKYGNISQQALVADYALS